MIEAAAFLDAARERGVAWYAGVPCSYLTPLTDRVIDDGRLSWLGAANEGDAVAAAAGATLGGLRAAALMQNSGLGNAVNPITSLLQTFGIGVLLLVTRRGDPELSDEPQHRLMGAITPSLLDAMEVPLEPFPSSEAEIAPALERAWAALVRSVPYAFLVPKGSLAGSPRSERSSSRPPVRAEGRRERSWSGSGARATRTEALARIVEHTPERGCAVIATTGYTGRELFALCDRPSHLYMVGSMGCAPSLGLGLSLARPDLRVVVIDGDGALLMRMGNLATIGAYGGANLVHVVLDNEVHDSTGAQATVSAGVSFAGAAASCGYPLALEGDDPGLLDGLFAAQADGPRLAHLKIRPGAPPGLPRPSLSPPEVRARFQDCIGERP